MLNKSTFMNKEEVGEIFGITQHTVGSWMKTGVLVEGKHWTKLGNRLYFSKSEIAKLLPGEGA